MTNKTNVSTLDSLLEGAPTNALDLKCIELVKYVDPNRGILRTTSAPEEFDNIMLLNLSLHNKYDTILAWMNKSDWKSVYLGHWNDGVVGNE